MDEDGCEKKSISSKRGKKQRKLGRLYDNEDSDKQRRSKTTKRHITSQVDHEDSTLDTPKYSEVFQKVRCIASFNKFCLRLKLLSFVEKIEEKIKSCHHKKGAKRRYGRCRYTRRQH